MTENTKNNNTDNNHNKSYTDGGHHNAEETKDIPGLLPPQALPTPPPPPPPTQDTSTLLSPWWSEEPPTETIETEPDSHSESSSTTSNELNNHSSSTKATSPKTEKDPTPNSSILNISILSFGRSSPKDSQDDWRERCILLATTTELSAETKKKQENAKKELEEIFDKSKECSMICFLRSSRKMTRDRLLKENNGELPITFSLNPFYGTWISVAKTPKRCKEHLLDGNICKKSFPDYYTMELGEELSRSGEYVTKAVTKTFSPLQHLTQRYIDSWKNGNQQAFFTKFWSSVQKGDAFHLVRDSTKRLIENALGHDKKPSDKK